MGFMNLYKDLETYDHDSNGAKITTLRVIVEIPRGSLIKYELDPTGRYMTAVRAMDKKYPYIYSYGCIPQTLGGDNDPLDAIIIYDQPFQSGTVLNCKVIGVVTTEDKGEEDDKILCIPYFDKKTKVEIKKILNYLNNYKYPNQEGTFIKQVLGIREANQIIKKSMKNFKEANL